MVKNYMEHLVDEILHDMMRDADHNFVCTCDACLDGMRAIVLNNIKPFYVTCKTGEVFGEYSNKTLQNRVDILSEIARAKEIVGKNPRHPL